MHFKPVTPKIEFARLEEEITKYWKENRIFEKSIDSRPEDRRWTFLDGPPFVTGVPHYGSLLSSLPKDLFGRYYTMKGYRVRRVWGWDGHGLPIENKVEGALNVESKRDIEEKIGIKTFIDECKKYVNEVSAEWEWYVDKIGRWADFKNAYKTWDRDYMESVMWVFKEMYEGGHIYRGLRVTLYCPHCATPISNFEVAMDADNYREVEDFGTTYKYELEGEKGVFILAWSTTPWNKLVTPALAVNPKLTYVKIKQGEETYILAKTTLDKVVAGSYDLLAEISGEDLIGKRYIPHYDYYKDKIAGEEKAFVVIGGDFVTAEEGTGVVTIAAYGVEDLEAMRKNNIHIETHVDEEGHIAGDVPGFAGMYYLKANKAVNEDLAERGLIYKDEKMTHSVPLCWRCHTRLYYAPINAWYVNVQDLKGLMIKTNEEVNWYPKHFKHGRFLKSLENAPDWNISRNRYWGSPVPVWECEDCGERFVPGSISELEEASGAKVTELHKPEIDEVIVRCTKCGGTSKRTPEVLDSWIEAGSASFAERHFPFNKEEKLADFFPPDYIAEYTGQIRAWFYVMHVIGAAIYKSRAFKNVSVEGVILGTDGRKMSKNYGNYPDPKELLDKYGGDALRLYLLGSPVMNGEDIIISEESYRNQVRGTLLILWNIYNFFVSYANIDGWDRNQEARTSENVLDRWILSLLHRLVNDVTKSLDEYDTVSSIGRLQDFVNEFSTWYIRRSRDRVGPSSDEADDKGDFYATTYEVLVTLSKIAAPIIPFVTEEIYRNLTGEESVHIADWPQGKTEMIDVELESEMSKAKALSSLIHEHRKSGNVKVKIPLVSLNYDGPSELNDKVMRVVLDETNVERLSFGKKQDEWKIDGLFDESNQNIDAGLARDIIRKIQAERKNLGTNLDERVDVELPEWPENYEEVIRKGALVDDIKKSESLRVIRKNA